MPTPPAKVAFTELPRHKGSYVLLLELVRPETVIVGRLGPLAFASGFFAYVGSAKGNGGLAARLGRHLRPANRCHWHIDYLRSRAPVVAIWAVWGGAETIRLDECHLADRLARQSYIQRPFKGFGSSDCACFSHLLHWPNPGISDPSFAKRRSNAIARLDKVLAPLARLQ